MSIDLDAYLARAGIERPPAPSVAALDALHRAHLAAYTFDNADIALGGVLSLAIEDVEAKLVRRGQGGLCFEHGLLFAAVLEQLGFEVSRLLARISPDTEPTGGLTHMTVLTEAEGRRFLCDVGFGFSPPAPLELIDGAKIAGDFWGHELRERDDGSWALVMAGREHASHASPLVDTPLVDFEQSAWWISTHPDSRFTGQLVALRSTAEERIGVVGRELRVERPGQEPETSELDEDGLRTLLTGRIDLRRGEEELERLLRAFRDPGA